MSKIGNQGFIRTVWKYFRRNRLAKERIKQEVVGTDSLGNTYVLKHADKELNMKESRMVLPTEEVALMYGERLGMSVPPEWNAWLRFSRDVPPTEEEIEMNRLKKLKIQQRVKELAEKERQELQIQGEAPNKENNQEIAQNISGDTTKAPFPIYDDLFLTPGALPKPPKD